MADELDLGCGASNVKADLYKLLLYEKGAFFLSHQDSEKADRMFGTLVICLPSKHEGGEIVAAHTGQSRVFKTDTTSEFGYSFAAWYSDVTHAIQPVLSGHRLVLTYNLIQCGPPLSLAARSLGDAVVILETAFSLWRSDSTMKRPIVRRCWLSSLIINTAIITSQWKI